jgi:hypothetical protein
MQLLRAQVLLVLLLASFSTANAVIQKVQYEFKNFGNPPGMGTASVSWSGSFPGEGEV